MSKGTRIGMDPLQAQLERQYKYQMEPNAEAGDWGNARVYGNARPWNIIPNEFEYPEGVDMKAGRLRSLHIHFLQNCNLVRQCLNLVQDLWSRLPQNVSTSEELEEAQKSLDQANLQIGYLIGEFHALGETYNTPDELKGHLTPILIDRWEKHKNKMGKYINEEFDIPLVYANVGGSNELQQLYEDMAFHINCLLYLDESKCSSTKIALVHQKALRENFDTANRIITRAQDEGNIVFLMPDDLRVAAVNMLDAAVEQGEAENREGVAEEQREAENREGVDPRAKAKIIQQCPKKSIFRDISSDSSDDDIPAYSVMPAAPAATLARPPTPPQHISKDGFFGTASIPWAGKKLTFHDDLPEDDCLGDRVESFLPHDDAAGPSDAPSHCMTTKGMQTGGDRQVEGAVNIHSVAMRAERRSRQQLRIENEEEEENDVDEA